MKRNIPRGLSAAVLWLCLSASASAASPRPGDVPPDALGNDRAGNPVSVSQHRGKVVIVTFWASWCGPCRRELPILGHVQKTVGRDHLEVIAVNLNEPRADFAAVIRANPKLKLTYVHDKGPAAELYGVTSVPHMFIIDRDGTVAYVHRGYSPEMLEGFVQEMMSLLPPEVLSRAAG
ncbi:TlpA family protein disulfide reductase [Lysobacter arvi]|uniref:TlpA disulfide reductase family protein n=1 Tax=Lysobacter arvi TaxID=3038776 RepID=A0ABU1CAN5_9GAMM|nr:TlpA disulfide reductase family protein [Lysobacter arvi]MDR0182254.1 TlpA disulfide reductase family protein [Lysobacter arvi]